MKPARGLAVWLALAAPCTAIGDVRIYGQISGVPALSPGVGFALHLAREDLALQYGRGEASETLALRRLGLSLSEAVGDRSRMGLRLGRLWTRQSGRAATEEVDPVGHYIDLAFGTGRALGGGVHASVDATWRYAVADATGENDTEVELEWQGVTVRPALRFPLGERIALRTGASIIAVDGDERVRGSDGGATTEFESDGHVGAFAALELMPHPDDIVTFRVEGGPRTGVYVSFEHRY